MNKVKVFYFDKGDYFKIEPYLNEFIKDKNIISINCALPSGNFFGGGVGSMFTILYKE